ncbi:lytic murein transglycosylase B [Nitrosomonas sp. Is37]|uniref:lytic murein transglycosylase B n=1 Tax=Nitrosomonas sp. Is37 TaxID=3080535 RepID=UPI00294B0A98|nr:lytic murein transglycosylase B [Nitrosomonas sp. Is37]MDV6345217.1 lytic murein transglycosylase B [Nitrosomonas sp. Is37]
MHLIKRNYIRQVFTMLTGLFLIFWSMALIASPLRQEIRHFINEMVAQHGFNQSELEDAFKKVQFQPSIIDLISVPASSIPWNKYRARFINPQRIKSGVNFWNEHAQKLEQASQAFGVPEEIIVAIIGVETAYGATTGKHRVIDALTTLAFDFPRRAEFFKSELEQYLLLAQEQNFDLFSIKGSYAGAIGFPQFMPGSYRRYAIDFDGDGKTDLAGNAADAIGSVANYLKEYGWEAGGPIVTRAHIPIDSDHYQEILLAGIEPIHSVKKLRAANIMPLGETGDERLAALIELKDNDTLQYWLGFQNFYVITRYNRSTFYAMSVLQLAEAIRAARNSGLR